MSSTHSILIVDDNPDNREVLRRQLVRLGHEVTQSENGRQALDMMATQSFDLLLLDIMMPEMNGYEVLEALRADSSLGQLPVVVISAVAELESVARCVQLGADDYLFKPFEPVLLRARVEACLEKKRLRDQEQAFLMQLQEEREKSEKLLLSILPRAIAEKLKRESGAIAESFPEATILFADIDDFSMHAGSLAPTEMLNLLNEVFSAFDRLCQQCGVEKIKTIGDAYMAAGGLPTPRQDHAPAMAELALGMQREIAQFDSGTGKPLSLTIGINSGPVVAGVIGKTRFIYDLWGETVNTASAVQSYGLAECIQITDATRQLLQDQYLIEERGSFYVKGQGEVATFLLTGKRSASRRSNHKGRTDDPT